MKRVFMCAFLIIIATVAMGAPVVIVLAQAGPVAPVEPAVTFGWTVLSWFVYAVTGLLASVAFGKEPFDAKKIAKSILLMVIAGVFALAFRLTPGAVTTQYGASIDLIATTILNTAPGLWLIYVFDKIYQFTMHAKARMEAAAMGPGPPSPS